MTDKGLHREKTGFSPVQKHGLELVERARLPVRFVPMTGMVQEGNGSLARTGFIPLRSTGRLLENPMIGFRGQALIQRLCSLKLT